MTTTPEEVRTGSVICQLRTLTAKADELLGGFMVASHGREANVAMAQALLYAMRVILYDGHIPEKK